MLRKILFILSIASFQLYAQQTDSITFPVISDSLISAFADSVAAADTTIQKRKSDIDAVVYASATDSLTFDVKNKKMYIYGTGTLKYKQSELTSGEVVADFVTNTLSAKGVVDTADSTGKNIVQTPILSEGGEKYEGSNLKYNFKTQQGFISLAKNEEKNSRYEGKKVKKVSKNTFFIEDGIYTTCEEDPPHTHFSASKMKVIQGDKIIAEWIFMHIGGVPLPIPLPFAVFPNKTGRRSGLIIPTYGLTAGRGQFFRNFGYFLALNDYMDLTFTGDYYTRGGYGARSRLRYAKRYNFNGNINAGFSNNIIGESGDPDKQRSKDWSISVFHHQDFNPTTKLDANLSFQSGSYLQNNTFDYTNRLTRDVNSSATLSKRWDESGNSLSMSYQRTQNLESGNIREVAPNMTFNMPLTHPFENKSGNKRDKEWYEYLGYNYSTNFRNTRNKIDGDLKIRGGIQHNLDFSASPKLSHFSISPRIGYREKWYNKKIDRRVIQITDSTGTRDSIATTDVNEINFVRTFETSLSANTKLYGMFPINSFGVDAVRHTVTPSISYSYRPDFSKSFWGYYDEYTTSDGEVVQYDKYGNEVFGGASSGESQSINLSIGNVFEMKTLKDQTDTTSEAKKIQLLNLSASTGYNFVRDSLKLSDLRLSYRTQIGEYLTFNGSSSYSFYDDVNGRIVDQFLISKGKGLFRLNDLSLSFSTSLSGDKIAGEKRNGRENEEEDLDFESFNQADYIGIYDEPPADFSVPWNLSLDYNYRISRNNPEPTSNIGGTLGINLTENWKITMRGNYDFKQKEITAPHITIFRDLHCWEMNFQWYPFGSLKGFRFEIRMKAPELSDIKVRKSGGLVSGF